MKILFDHGTPAGLKAALGRHTVLTAKQQGWDRLSNGNLIHAAEEFGFELLLSTDGNIRYQQNLAKRRIALVVLRGHTAWKNLRLHVPEVVSLVERATPGSYAELNVPFGKRNKFGAGS